MHPPAEDPDRLSATAATLALAHSIADGVLVLDAAHRLVAINPAAEVMLGWSHQELRGHDISTAERRIVASGSPLLSVARSGEAVRSEDDRFVTRDGTELAVAYTASPVREAGQAVLGTVVVFRDVTSRRAAEAEAARAAAERAAVLDELQVALLPGLPTVEGLDLALAFRPVGSHVLVGGDFVDVFPAPGGHVVVLGDVCGKGPRAASVGAMVRYVLHGACHLAPDLEAMLLRVNTELLRFSPDRFVTLVLMHVSDEESGRRFARVASAGHPWPVLLRVSGQAQAVGGHGPLLGVFSDPVFAMETVELAPGDALVLHSDGVTDVGFRAGAPEIDVAAVLAGRQGDSADQLVTRVEDAARLLDHDELPDDVAILAVRYADQRPVQREVAEPVGEAPVQPAEIGHVEAEFRTLNERVLHGRPQREDALAVICECGHPGCREVISVPRARFTTVRETDRCFVIAPGHEVLRAEEVFERRDSYWLIRKHGEAGRAAERAQSGG